MRRPGFTILELLMVIWMSGIIGGILTTYIVKSYSQNRKVEATSITQKDLNFAIDRFNRILRSTTQLLNATETVVTIRGYPNAADTVPSEISMYLSSPKVLYSVIPPTGSAPNYTYNPVDAKIYTLLPNVTNSVALPLFKYYDDTNTQLSYPISLANVKIVELSASAKDSANIITTPISVTTRATLRNFKTNL